MRKSTTEMRAPNIARSLTDEVVAGLATEIKASLGDAQAAILPAIFSSRNFDALDAVRSQVRVPVYTVSTIPISVPGMSMQLQLRDYFTKLGGIYMLGDSVLGGEISNGTLKYVTTVNHEDEHFYADNFILASGSFLSHGLVSNIDKVFEPIFGLDVEENVVFKERADSDMYAPQSFMGYGVVTDSKFNVSIGGNTISNLYACGSVIGGCNPIEDGCGGGVAILTALKVASLIVS
jgi:glycerol-3-phosphate dehydrogenase subunit B